MQIFANKQTIFTLMIALISSQALADDIADKYFSQQNPSLTRQEQQALDIAQKWHASSDQRGVKPFSGPDGSVKFIYGAQAPSIVCAVLQVCDIALQPGELINSIQLGDTSRWIVEPAISGTGLNEVQHLLIKPMDVGLETSLVIPTNRRTYHIRLKSHRTQYMPEVSFTYPEEAAAKWAAIKSREQREIESKLIPATGEYLGDLSFDYDIDGSAAWKPLRVYNDGVKTIIEMPDDIKQKEAPILLELRGQGGLFTGPEEVMVNYRLQGDRYIVDSIFEKAILMTGVGGNQEKITITKR